MFKLEMECSPNQMMFPTGYKKLFVVIWLLCISGGGLLPVQAQTVTSVTYSTTLDLTNNFYRTLPVTSNLSVASSQLKQSGAAGNLAIWVYDTTPDTTPSNKEYQSFTVTHSFKLSGNNDSFGIFFYNGGDRTNSLLAVFNPNYSGQDDEIRFFSGASMLTYTAGTLTGPVTTRASGGFNPGATYKAVLKVRPLSTTSAWATLTISDPMGVVPDFSVSQTFTGLSVLKGEIGFRSNMNAAGNAYFDDLTIFDATLTPPRNVTAIENGVTGSTISWDPVYGATSYKVYRDATLLGSIAGTTYTDAFSLNGPMSIYRSYEYQIEAYDQASVASAKSSPSIFAYRRFPFVLPWDDSSTGTVLEAGSSAITASQLITVNSGRLYRAGSPYKLMGVNLAYKACFPAKNDAVNGDMAEKIAARLSKLGVNCVRCFLDATAPSGLVASNGSTLDATQLDAFDYFVSRLKAHGIYVDLILHSFRYYPGFATAGFTAGTPFRGVDNFSPDMIASQKNYASLLLGHVNAYTGLTYAADPVVALIEINNENGLINEWRNRLFENGIISSDHNAELKSQWNTWLGNKYVNTTSISAAWGPSTGKSYGVEMVSNGTFSSGYTGWTVQTLSTAVATKTISSGAAPDGSNALEINVTATATESWKVQLYQGGKTIAANQPYTMTFWAKSENARTVNVGLFQNHDNCNLLGQARVNVTSNWQQYTAVIIPNVSDSNSRIQIGEMGNVLGKIWIANVRTKTGNTLLGPSSAWAEGILGAEMLANGNFEAGCVPPWRFEPTPPAAGTQSVVLGSTVSAPAEVVKALEMNVTTACPTASWRVQMYQAGLVVAKDSPYTATFWAKSDTARSIPVSFVQAHDPWGVLCEKYVRLDTTWRQYQVVLNPSVDDGNVRLQLGGLAALTGKVWVGNMSLKTGASGTGLLPGETRGTVDIFNPSTIATRSRAAQKDWMDFLFETEKNYWTGMRNYIRSNCTSSALVIGTQARYSPATIQALMDVVDDHGYWQHPIFPGTTWDTSNWYIRNISMAGEPNGGEWAQVVANRVAGKPFICSEYNHPAPNTYGSETLLLASAYAAMQNCDGLFLYNYQQSDNWTDGYCNQWFKAELEPSRCVTIPMASAILRGSTVTTASNSAKVQITPSDARERLLSTWPLNVTAFGVDYKTSLIQPVSITSTNITVSQVTSPVIMPTTTILASTSNELEWDTTNKTVTIDTAKTKAVIGRGGSTQFEFGDGVQITPGSSMQPGDWSAIAMTLKTGVNFTTPGSRILITATGYADNHGMIWNAGMSPIDATSSIGANWGRYPSLVEGIDATIVLPLAPAKVAVWSLDETGQHKNTVSVTGTTHATFTLSRSQKTIWYEVLTTP